MSHVYFIGDLHFGHERITRFRPFDTELEHREHIIAKWNTTIRKRDIVYVMGDVAFTVDGLESVGSLAGTKVLIRGNHDLLPTDAYLEHFQQVYGMFKYKGMWLTHAPIHPQELYGRSNVHGHCHRSGPTDVTPPMVDHNGNVLSPATYFNTCAEHLPEPYHPIEYHRMMGLISERIKDG